MDYIGVDSYFPISQEKTPSVKGARQGWQGWKMELADFSAQQDRKILFTEIGYRSFDFAGKAPWESDRSLENVNLKAQQNLTEAFFKEIWNEPWFAGSFIWKWHPSHAARDGLENTRFSPQNKPAEKVISQSYKTISTLK